MINLFTNVRRIWAQIILAILLVSPGYLHAQTSDLKLTDLSLVQAEQLELNDLGKIYLTTLREQSLYYDQLVRLKGNLPPQTYGLGEAEEFAFYDYTFTRYVEINKSLWAGNLNMEQIAYIRIFDSALRKLPSQKIKVYRGTQAFEPLTTGQIIEFKGYSSTSARESIGKSFAKGRFFIINTSTGKDISKFSYYSEAEVLIPRNTFFRVDKISTEMWPQSSKPIEVVEITELE